MFEKTLKSLVVLAVGMVSMVGVVPAAEAKRYNVKVQFCGLTGPDENFQVLDIVDGSPRFNDFFKEKEMYVWVSSFNGKDRAMVTARKRKVIRTGGSATFKCNDKKGGCKFRVKFDSQNNSAVKVSLNRSRYLYFQSSTYNSPATKSRRVAIRITKAIASVKPRHKCTQGTSQTTIGCKYLFNGSNFRVEVLPDRGC